MITSIYQEVELSLTENLIPVTVPVKQYDNRARKVRCVLYNNSVQYSVPVSYTHLFFLRICEVIV